MVFGKIQHKHRHRGSLRNCGRNILCEHIHVLLGSEKDFEPRPKGTQPPGEPVPKTQSPRWAPKRAFE